MQQYFRVEKQTFLSGEDVEQLVRDAGFVDVSVKVVKLEFGEWGPGQLRLQKVDSYFVDPNKHEIARNCGVSWSESMENCAKQMTRYYPNDEERYKFADAVKKDVTNPDYHLYSRLYRSIQ